MPPTFNDVECEINTSDNWQPCTSALWNQTILRVRANCTSSASEVSYVTFNLTNVPDSATKINSSNATSHSGDYWIYNNSDLKIADSGKWNLTIGCYDVYSVSDTNTTSWIVPWGVLNATWVSPTTHTNVSQNASTGFISRVECLIGECGDINVTIDPTEPTFINYSIALNSFKS